MARKPRRPSPASIKAAADRAEARAKGVEPEEPTGVLNPPETKRRVGRPTKYGPAMCETVLDLGAAGKSKAQIASQLGISRETLDIWARTHKEFSDSVKAAQELALAWWENKGQEHTFESGKGFNATAFIFQMKNRFRDDYRDTTAHEHSGPGGGPIETKETSELETVRRVAFMLGRAVERQKQQAKAEDDAAAG